MTWFQRLWEKVHRKDIHLITKWTDHEQLRILKVAQIIEECIQFRIQHDPTFAQADQELVQREQIILIKPDQIEIPERILQYLKKEEKEEYDQIKKEI